MSEEINSNEPVQTESTADEAADVQTPKEKTYSEAEYNALKSQLDALEQAAKDNEDFKKKFEESEQARKDFEYKTKVSAYVKSLGLKDDVYEKHVENLILEKGLQFDGGKLIGGDDIVNSFKETHAHAFKSDEKPQSFTAPTGNNAPTVLSGVEQAFLRKNPNIKL